MKKNSKKTILLADDMETHDAKDQKRSQSVRFAATALAQKLNSSIEMVHSEDITLYPVPKPYYKEYIQNFISEKQYRLKKAAKSLKVPVHISLLEGYPAETLTKLTAKKNIYELLVMGSHGRKGMKRAILGSVAEEVIRNSKIPVLVLGPEAQIPNQKFLTENPIQILVATDLTNNGKHAEDYAFSLAQRMSAKVVLFHSFLGGIQPLLGSSVTPGNIQEDFQEMLEKLKSDALHQLDAKARKMNKLKVDCTSCFDGTSLTPSAAILSQIRKLKPSFLIMGTHGRNFLSEAFLGSTAREMILNSPIPVLIIRSR